MSADLLEIARASGLREHMHGVNAQDSRALLAAFVEKLDSDRAAGHKLQEEARELVRDMQQNIAKHGKENMTTLLMYQGQSMIAAQADELFRLQRDYDDREAAVQQGCRRVAELEQGLRIVMRTLETPQEAIVDTVWAEGPRHETLYDFCSTVLGDAPAPQEKAGDLFERLGSTEVWNIVRQVARQLAGGTAKLADMLTAVDAYGHACKTEARTPAGYVKADQALYVEAIFAELRDLWPEALAVDTMIGRPEVLRERIAKLRDAVGQAANGYVPLGGKLRPIHITVLIDWLTARYRAAGGKEGITDLSAWSEEVMRWTERQHRISFEEPQG